jgi:uncharacterized protein (TIGR02186 family)
MRRCGTALGIFIAALAATPTAAERLVTSVSTYRVLINSNFTGTELVLFGAIELNETSAPRPNGYAVAVTVRGPARTFVTRRKSRMLGLWVNTQSRQFLEVPSYLAVLTNRPLEEVGAPDQLRRLRIGLSNHVLTQRVGSDFGDVVPQDPFRSAFLRVKTSEGLFYEQTTGVTFLTPWLFRATVPIPGIAPIGGYEVETLLLADGELLARERTAIEVVKAGVESWLAQAARENRLAYGLAAVILALASGAIGSLLFRSD